MTNNNGFPNLYSVGYGKPPKTSQFEKRKSGNPKGRPKGSKNLDSIVRKESQQKVRINGPNGSRDVTKLQASIMQLINKAAKGDSRAQRDFHALVRMAEERARPDAPPVTHELDHQVIKNILKRFKTVSSPTSTSETAISK